MRDLKHPRPLDDDTGDASGTLVYRIAAEAALAAVTIVQLNAFAHDYAVWRLLPAIVLLAVWCLHAVDFTRWWTDPGRPRRLTRRADANTRVVTWGEMLSSVIDDKTYTGHDQDPRASRARRCAPDDIDVQQHCGQQHQGARSDREPAGS